MIWLTGIMLVIAAAAGLLVVLSRNPKRQIFALCANGLVLSLLFFALQAPDVALSEIVVGAVVVPLLFLVALAAVAVARVRK
ncbi:MAG TPA: hydrogenase subunit MbhD domain-containing protein [Rhizobiaceae bacterium]|nr:hydrogenase subunit MbhD domain-containing protein [Rhizobiaceae bacterium]